MPSRNHPEAIGRPDLYFELPLWRAGCSCVGGIDEAGRGALAGPVSAAVVVLPANPFLPERLSGVNDSKLMTADQRHTWAEVICQQAEAFAVGFAAASEIDALGILPATRLAASRALDQLSCTPGHLLLDWLFLPEVELPQTSLVKGDQRSLSIAAASVLAKTARDILMVELDREYPGYELSRHKGYGTARHLAALQNLGPSPIHRYSYQPVRLAGLAISQ
jgi:ribonuclease HII